MKTTRRKFLKLLSAVGLAAALPATAASQEPLTFPDYPIIPPIKPGTDHIISPFKWVVDPLVPEDTIYFIDSNLLPVNGKPKTQGVLKIDN